MATLLDENVNIKEDDIDVQLNELAEIENKRKPFLTPREQERADFEIKAREQAYQKEMNPEVRDYHEDFYDEEKESGSSPRETAEYPTLENKGVEVDEDGYPTNLDTINQVIMNEGELNINDTEISNEDINKYIQDNFG